MAYLDDLIARREAIAAELAAGETPAGQSFRQPTIIVDGEEVDTTRYVQLLYFELDQIEARLAVAGGPWEVSSRGTT